MYQIHPLCSNYKNANLVGFDDMVFLNYDYKLLAAGSEHFDIEAPPPLLAMDTFKYI
jgi:hypothetical protein